MNRARRSSRPWACSESWERKILAWCEMVEKSCAHSPWQSLTGIHSTQSSEGDMG